MLITIGVCGQAAILFKKWNEYRKERKIANNIQIPVNQNNNQQINNQRWNHHVCSNSGTITIIVVIFLVGILMYIQNWWILNQHLNKEEAMHLMEMLGPFLYCIGVPLTIYARNDKLYKHVKNELSDIF